VNTSKRYYFDYNATSPLASKVKEWLKKGDFPFGNPSSIHASGKISKRAIFNVSEFLFSSFGLKESQFKIFYHSGATEGINTVIKGCGHKLFAENKKLHFLYLASDHSCVRTAAEELKVFGHIVTEIGVDRNGEYNHKEVIEAIKKNKAQALFNLTWVNNETGVVLDLEQAKKVKEATNCWLHVDAAQSVGKVAGWDKLSPEVDSYSYSGHKFGALKGIGMTFINDHLAFSPLIHGGEQQVGLRSGTENILGIMSIKLALEEMIEKFRPEESLKGKEYLEEKISEALGKNGEIISIEAKQRNIQTISFVLYRTKSEQSAMALDIAGIEVSTGSACSSGTVSPSKVLMAMGYSEQWAKSALRLSFGADFNLEQAKVAWKALAPILQRFLPQD
jgi:cysteine desulfurase